MAPTGKSLTISILLIVFIAGYLVMALEILAFRIIQINFGSSIFSTGAVLGIVLAALTCGYWLGGNLSVRHRPTTIQATALIIASLWIFTLAGIPRNASEFLELRENPTSETQPLLTPPWKTISNWIIDNPASESMEFRMRFDPLLGSLILFAFPSFLLAMIGPCAIRALTSQIEQTGRISGWIFALGSLGSIAGVLVTSFWLIAFMGIAANLRLIGIVALLFGIAAASLRYKSW